jgi:fructose-1,6-bisphosphatase/inositol monophosphatase family enzyme
VFGTLIALLRNGEPIIGVIDQPITKERWVGVKDHGTTLNGRPSCYASNRLSLTFGIVLSFTAYDAQMIS